MWIQLKVWIVIMDISSTLFYVESSQNLTWNFINKSYKTWDYIYTLMFIIGYVHKLWIKVYWKDITLQKVAPS
jgi:hypothetical protein